MGHFSIVLLVYQMVMVINRDFMGFYHDLGKFNQDLTILPHWNDGECKGN